MLHLTNSDNRHRNLSKRTLLKLHNLAVNLALKIKREAQGMCIGCSDVCQLVTDILVLHGYDSDSRRLWIYIVFWKHMNNDRVTRSKLELPV
uniref:Uncharacterized protein n=1 Tax=Tanacetum cinerariifolium TaxID=118510 RepID=A0A6L2LU91_TANCI|nr:hypothetical protein [Tanacetum cinerariifolium]